MVRITHSTVRYSTIQDVRRLGELAPTCPRELRKGDPRERQLAGKDAYAVRDEWTKMGRFVLMEGKGGKEGTRDTN